jgi:hypothetical protein
MHQMSTNKVSVAGIDRYLAGLQQEVRRSARRLLLVRVVYFGGLASLGVLLAILVWFAALPIVIGVVFFTWVFYRGAVARHALVQRREAFLGALLRRLRDDLAPTEKLRVDYQVQPLDALLHAVRSTKTSAGNLKTYYRHRWLRVRGTLADGTRFRMRLQRAAKSKRGEVLREQSAMILEVRPPAGSYRGSLVTAVTEAGEALPWGAGEVTMKPSRDRLVFRVLTRESDMIEHVYQALRHAVALYRGRPPKRAR